MSLVVFFSYPWECTTVLSYEMVRFFAMWKLSRLYFVPVSMAESILHAKLFAHIDLYTHVHNIYMYTQYSSLISLNTDVNRISKEKETPPRIALLKDADLLMIPAAFKAWLLTIF